jgi:hypothetical protein
VLRPEQSRHSSSNLIVIVIKSLDVLGHTYYQYIYIHTHTHTLKGKKLWEKKKANPQHCHFPRQRQQSHAHRGTLGDVGSGHLLGVGDYVYACGHDESS